MKASIDFLTQLDKNNNREWFQKHKSEYSKAQEEVIAFAEQLLTEMHKHDVIETPTGKKSLFRIYRDVRFSHNKSPYKTHWAGRFKRAGIERRGGYYYHIGVKETYVAGGFFAPNPADLLHIRKQIELDATPLREVMNSSEFKKYFGELKGEAVKTAPKGFSQDHPDIDLLRHKQFILRHTFPTGKIYERDFPKQMAAVFSKMRPFFDCMTEYLTTDLNGIPLV